MLPSPIIKFLVYENDPSMVFNHRVFEETKKYGSGLVKVPRGNHPIFILLMDEQQDETIAEFLNLLDDYLNDPQKLPLVCIVPKVPESWFSSIENCLKKRCLHIEPLSNDIRPESKNFVADFRLSGFVSDEQLDGEVKDVYPRDAKRERLYTRFLRTSADRYFNSGAYGDACLKCEELLSNTKYTIITKPQDVAETYAGLPILTFFKGKVLSGRRCAVI